MFWAPWGDRTPGSSLLTRQPSASVLYRQMRASAAAARSVHVKGAFVEQGKKLQIDVAGDRAGQSSRAIVNAGTGEIEIPSVNGSKIYVSTDGLARLMRVEGAKDEGALDFTEWDAVPPLSPPPRDQIVTLPGL